MFAMSPGPITPEMQARLDKYGSTLNKHNLDLVIERIGDYPEIIQAVKDYLEKGD